MAQSRQFDVCALPQHPKTPETGPVFPDTTLHPAAIIERLRQSSAPQDERFALFLVSTGFQEPLPNLAGNAIELAKGHEAA
jgi:hypothetical protein